jgi:hypothetical protein
MDIAMEAVGWREFPLASRQRRGIGRRFLALVAANPRRGEYRRWLAGATIASGVFSRM